MTTSETITGTTTISSLMSKPKRHYYLAIMGCYSPEYGYEEVSAYELNERKQAWEDLKEYRLASPDASHILKRRWELELS